jgi:hypothetical protein
MFSFVFSLGHGATPLQQAMVMGGLEGRFPAIRFMYDAEVLEGHENTIMPVAGEQHPTEPNRVVITPIPLEMVVEVREVFGELLLQAKALRPS